MSEFHARSPVVKRKRVSFAEDVKEHDGLKPSTQLFDLLVVHYMKIGGMTDVAQMTTFLTEKECSITIDARKELISLSNDLLERLRKTPKDTPILTEGGGSKVLVPVAALPNIEHMVIALGEELKFQQSLRTSVSVSASVTVSVTVSASASASDSESTNASVGGG
jgi:hypothetical protein